ncbi:hypothetical protein [Methanomethylovorans sp.]|uniref:hypothetical protein n=1 Tax=Methanomethylovorans sp. TaxID=2758717 RepID=UPI00351BEE84
MLGNLEVRSNTSAREIREGWFSSILLFTDEKATLFFWYEGSIMGLLNRCPQCYAKLQTNENAIWVCEVCGYLTKSVTARLEALVLYDSIILPTWGEEDECDFEEYMY